MSVFRHPHRIHGIVRTRMGAFAVSRGLVEAPDDVGETIVTIRPPPGRTTSSRPV
jgi:hypothetical protein